MATSSAGQYDLLDQLAEEFAQRFRRGERPSLQEYVDRYPHLADGIRDLFPALVEVERVEKDRHEPGEPPPRRCRCSRSATTTSCARSAVAAWASSTRRSSNRWVVASP